MIKYHQNGVDSWEYDAVTHELTNNWNPDGEYADNEYVRIYFRMETKGYSYPTFSFTEKDREAVNTELHSVFTSIGWVCKQKAYNGTCATYTNGLQHLYLHPQNYSGYVKKNEVKKIAEAIEKRENFYLRWVDLYETAYDYTDEEFEDYLSKGDVRTQIINSCKTVQRTYYMAKKEVIHNTALHHSKVRITENNREVDETAKEYVTKVVEELLALGYLVSVENNGIEYIRTINKTEAKKKKLII